MTIRIAAALALIGQSVMADPMFQDRSDSIPEHIYAGGWEHFVGGGVAIFDCNGDSLPDLFAAGGENPAMLLRNDGEFAFAPIEGLGLTAVTGAYPLDANGDGFDDLFILRVGQNALRLGDGNCGFAQEVLLPPNDSWSTAFTAWWEGDTWPVLAVGNYVDRDDPEGPFRACDENAILRYGAAGYDSSPLTPGFCPLAARDARGQHTLRLSNDRHYYVRDGYEQMWDIAEQRWLGPDDGWPRVSLWGMGIASRDLTGDDRDEVMLTSMGDQLMQLAQPDGSYRAAPFSIGTYAQRPHTGDDGRPSTGWHAQFGDVDNDGLADLFIAKGNVDQMPGLAMQDPNNLLIQQPDGTFAEAASLAGIATTARSRGAGLADLDGDGRLDLVVVNRRAPMEVYRNVTANTGNWLAIALTQSGPNRDAIGARVIVETALGRQSQQMTIGGGHAGGQLLPLHFGLGAADEATVTVVWPDGSQTQRQLTPNQTATLSR